MTSSEVAFTPESPADTIETGVDWICREGEPRGLELENTDTIYRYEKKAFDSGIH